MPELPEVELVARALGRLVTGGRIRAARLLRARFAPDTSPAAFARALRGAGILSVGRRGKHILINLDNDRVLITHLRMTGKFICLEAGAAPLPKHTHALFHLDDGRRLVFTDQRHFGMMKVVPAGLLHEAKELRGLAPEPFSEEFTPRYLHAALSRSRRTLKETLLDQRRVVGLGNIYAAEAMFTARLNPLTTANSLAKRRVARLHGAILNVLSESLAHGSATEVDPGNMDGSYYGGGAEGGWKVYGREGEPCPSCTSPIRRITQAGRSTFYCPRCQRG